ncbi:hypothetical protein TCAL_01465 [Tigriopus californicus]|uniref:Kazal-like domain-containing protein n=1 Tax=Tigriopus californicus TaxID=6832 RepID=A0A553N6C0_TIGCA|nr:serine protease inhibitor Kazal-type 1-like [Tigriopus californicus]TRY60986.1 hypothetical protein TCAL_01465 [Tigriopus californicus]
MKFALFALFVTLATLVLVNNAEAADQSGYMNCMASCPVPLIQRPVCGSDGNTYDNKQKFNCHKKCKRDRKMIRIVGDGPC